MAQVCRDGIIFFTSHLRLFTQFHDDLDPELESADVCKQRAGSNVVCIIGFACDRFPGSTGIFHSRCVLPVINMQRTGTTMKAIADPTATAWQHRL